MKGLFFLYRLALACVFIVAACAKLLAPVENFAFIVDSYGIPVDGFFKFIVFAFPWIELIFSTYLLVGLWTAEMLYFFTILSLAFSVLNLQAIIRHLPLEACGCFGELLPLSLPETLMLDIALFLALTLAILRLESVQAFSLDKLLIKRNALPADKQA